ncbi:phosphoribosylaminoimidazole-succinocarboxamide synthase [Pyrrhoderma noxium]|uniref:Phosphoribosylaminoimidazole-succinocarboxamide synthase n=1 Tax=Pyrrhoderma noxium TaxID=2282107 RepID=A0A286UK79_9AGAM|nr:phosphoribosylaminoimidazole-succinocarboxamide synthase [Pyrrhoderma noxium]
MASPSTAVTKTSLPETSTFKFISSGKVRDLYEIKDGAEEYLLFVATDRISAYDVILNNGVPGKGALLTKISAFWFNKLNVIIENHVVASTLDDMPSGIRSQILPYWDNLLKDRTLLVRKAKVVKLEVIVRGYLTGSAWSEYKRSGTVHGIKIPEGLVESSKLPEPLVTPSTKADQGEHDENISPEQARALIGNELYSLVENAAIRCFRLASEYALSKGVILADTKFEFGLIPTSSSSSSSVSPATISLPDPEAPGSTKLYSLILIDEALTPDSSRYWSAAAYEPGHTQASFDKQFLRDWLTSNGFKKGLESGPEGKEGSGWTMSEEVVEGTKERYEDVLKMLTG